MSRTRTRTAAVHSSTRPIARSHRFTRRAALLCTACLLAACGPSKPPTTSSSQVDSGSSGRGAPALIGRFATELSLDLLLDDGTPRDGGNTRTGVKLLALVDTVEMHTPPGTAATAWELCDVSLPGLADVPVAALDSDIAAGATVTHSGDSTAFVQPPFTLMVGAILTHPATDPLPTAQSPLCASDVATNCIFVDPIANTPGIALAAAGLTPDADIIYIDLRIALGLHGSFDWDGLIAGAVDSLTVESHVLACHLRSGTPCSPSDVAAIEAAHPNITFQDGTLRGRLQSTYFTCPQLVANPENSLALNPLPDDDAGTPSDAEFIPDPTFSTSIETDLDTRGCATGGCHETFTQPGQMHLVFQPSTKALLMQNYQAVLPFTIAPPTGGLFVNQVPIPTDMRARWLLWISHGTPF